MTAKYTEADLERARRWLDTNSSRSTGRGKRLAELIAEERERCARLCDATAAELEDFSRSGDDARYCAMRIRSSG